MPVKLTGLNYKGLPELPSVPTTVDQIKDAAEEALTSFRQLPIEQIVKDFAATVKELRVIVTSDELKADRAALSKSLKETELLIASLNTTLIPLVTNMNGATTDTRVLVKQFNQEIIPLLKSTEKTLDTATSVLLQSKQAVGSVEALADPGAPLWQSLEALRDAAQSTKNLTDYLERHPDSILYGKE